MSSSKDSSSKINNNSNDKTALDEDDEQQQATCSYFGSAKLEQDANNNNNEEEDEDYNYYDDYDGYDGLDGAGDDLGDDEMDLDPYANDPEYFDYEIYPLTKIDAIMQKKCDKVRTHLQLEDTFDIVYLLKQFKWNANAIVELYEKDKQRFMQLHFSDNNNNKSKSTCLVDRTKLTSFLNIFEDIPTNSANSIESDLFCAVCCSNKSEMDCLPLCSHRFCLDCWRTHFEMQIKMNATSFFECMESKCNSIASKEFVLKCLRSGDNHHLVDQYRRLVTLDLVKESEDLQLCPGELVDARQTRTSCSSIVWSKQKPAARRVQCGSCHTQYCFQCAAPYHAPNSCDTIRKWNLKCQDDSETRNYLLVHTQDCPKCKVCIEKNGGCSHMTCNRCKHEFCWVCLNDWKTHGATYDCNRYKGNPEQDNAREALNRYTHYYHRWINHANSLKFEKALKEQCRLKIEEKIMNRGGGTLVDWEFLNEAADLLTRARYTLQYTYPYAYFSENNECKLLFENIQAELEREVENLSHSLEKVNLNDKFNIKTQMTIVEKRRKTLLKDFIQ